jgi:hypothetical protein
MHIQSSTLKYFTVTAECTVWHFGVPVVFVFSHSVTAPNVRIALRESFVALHKRHGWATGVDMSSMTVREGHSR